MPEKIELKPFTVVGIGIETTNQNGKSGDDIASLWQRFYAENISSKIANKINHDVYSVYTDYESDYTGKYTVIIGHKVSFVEDISDELVSRKIEGGRYFLFLAKGRMPAAVISTWQEIWDKDQELKRTYSGDFEVYAKRSQDPTNGEVDIYIATDEKL